MFDKATAAVAVPEAPRGSGGAKLSANPRLVTLHIYDVGGEAAVEKVNDFFRPVGTGVFHAGVEVLGEEWSYGHAFGTGVYNCRPRRNPHHKYRESIVIGQTPLSEAQVKELIVRLKTEWPGTDYDLLTHNCCHFCRKMCVELGAGPTPEWLTNLAGAGAAVISGVGQAVSQVKTAAQVAGEKAEKLDSEYQISSKVEAFTNQEVHIDEESMGEKMRSMWSQATIELSKVGDFAERVIAEVQKPVTLDVEHLEKSAVSIWTRAFGWGIVPDSPTQIAREKSCTDISRSNSQINLAAGFCSLDRCRPTSRQTEELVLSPNARDAVMSGLLPDTTDKIVLPERLTTRVPSVRLTQKEASPAVPEATHTPPASEPALSTRSAHTDRTPSKSSSAKSSPSTPKDTHRGSDSQASSPTAPPAVAASASTSPPNLQQDGPIEHAEGDATKQAEFAASALDFDDVATAVRCIRSALVALGEGAAKPAAKDQKYELSHKLRLAARKDAEGAASALNNGDASGAKKYLRSALRLMEENN